MTIDLCEQIKDPNKKHLSGSTVSGEEVGFVGPVEIEIKHKYVSGLDRCGLCQFIKPKGDCFKGKQIRITIETMEE